MPARLPIPIPERWEVVCDEEIRAGDRVDVLGVIATVTAIIAYRGAFPEIFIAFAEFAPGVGFWLTFDGQTRRVRRT